MEIKRKQKIVRVNPADWPQGTPVEKAPDPDLGSELISPERYTSPNFMAREWNSIWSKVWLLGGRESDIREPGSYICTNIGRESVLIVRQEDGSIRAFYNVCLHRGNRLRGEGLGKASSFRCGYHDWEYLLDGSINHIPDLDTFPQGAPPCGRIPELPCDTWGSFVWFSLNPDVEPLQEFLHPFPAHLDPYHFERMAWTRDLTIEFDCNWKTSIDAFSEAYHTQGTHKQLLWYLDDLNVQIDCYERHSRYLVPFACISPRVNLPPSIPPAIAELMRKAGMDPADYDGPITDIRRDVQKFMRANGGAQGKDYSELNDDQLTDDYNYLIFPNLSLNIHTDDLWVFRHRLHETNPDKMYFDIMTFDLIPDGEEWPKRPKHATYKDGDKSIGEVLNQDAFNMPNVQTGMKSSAFKGLWLGRQEIRIRHFNKVVDDYIYGPGGKGPEDI
jgi:phenylpropionate dioxygenase-like ring-hydroxylating dioxygenase large terminal subunit